MSETQLTSLLQKEIDLLEKLNDFSLLKKEALCNDDLRKLEEISYKENTTFREYKMTNDLCSLRVRSFLTGDPDLSGADAEIKERILKMRGLATKLQTNNRFNMELIHDSLALVRVTLNILTAPAGEKASTYSVSGKVVGKNVQNHLLDYKG